MIRRMFKTALPGLLFLCCVTVARPQNFSSGPLNESGKVIVDGRPSSYIIRHLPVSSFPQLPPAVQETLTRRGCLIPQTYEAHQPENVVHASLEQRGSSDWAVLCSSSGSVSLLVFFASRYNDPMILASSPETERLQPHGASGALGFNWGIDAASPEQVREAQMGMNVLPPRVDHDALADSVVDQRTIYHFYSRGTWTLLDTQD